MCTDDDSAIENIVRGEAHIAIVTSDVSIKKKLTVKLLEESKFQTHVGEGHPLYSSQKRRN